MREDAYVLIEETKSGRAPGHGVDLPCRNPRKLSTKRGAGSWCLGFLNLAPIK